MATNPSGKESVSFSDFLQIIYLRKTLVALLFTLVLLTTLAVTALLPKEYLATSKIRVEKPEGEVKLFQAQTGSYYDAVFQQDQFRILQSEKILYQVISRLRLGERFAAELDVPVALSPAQAYRHLVDRMLRIEAQRSSSIIEINVLSKDPALAAAIANEIANVYSEDRILLATSEQRAGLGKLRGELESQERVVSAQRDAIEKLRKDLNISGVDLNARYSDMEIETLRQMQNSLIALRVDTIGRKTRWERFRAIPKDERLSLINSELIQDTNIQNLLQAFLVADQNVSRLRARLGEAHPELVAALESRGKMRQQLDTQLQGYEKSLEISYNEAQARVSELENQLAQAKVDQILSAREKTRPFEEAAQKLEDESRLLTTLKLTLRQREIDFQVPKKTIEILNVAEPSRVPAKPNWTLHVAAAFFFGIALGVGAALVLEYFDTSFRNVADIEGKLQLPALGILPLTESPDAVSLEDMAESEPYRVLHTNLNLTITPGQKKSLMLCSAGPGEGKSTALHNLARLISSSGERVVLIDSDLRRPVQHKLFDRPKSPGLSDYIRGVATLEQVLQKDVLPGLSFIPAGSHQEAALGLLHQNRLRQLITELSATHDKVLFDSPPVIGVSDASVLASVVDGVVFLIQYRRNPQSMVLRARQIFDSLKTPVLGVVLSQVPANSGDDYAYYTANYAYYGDGSRRRTKRLASRDIANGEKLDLIEETKKSEKFQK